MTHIKDWSSIQTRPTLKSTLLEIVDAIIGGLVILLVVGMSAGVLFLLK